ncbi:MAG: altronate dehydratase family protein [Thermoflexibacter sp.]|jgi:altronate hydrolase|nr:altronate dehydratase family protein [Thermoflexibacter sp.]
MNRILKIHQNDDVIVALSDLKAGESVQWNGLEYQLIENITAKHKFAIRDLQEGDEIKMYGVIIGKATQTILRGQAITTQNVKHKAEENVKKNKQVQWDMPDVSPWKDKTFMGFHRKNGKVGTANYWLVIPLVFCENRNINTIQKILEKELGYETGISYQINVQNLIKNYQNGLAPAEIASIDVLEEGVSTKNKRIFPNVDGIKFLTHEGGCGGTRQDSDALCALLAGYIAHPNVAGATVLSLGCQHAQTTILQRYLEKFSPDIDKPIFFLEQQKSPSEKHLIAEAVKKTFIGLIEADKTTRRPAPLSKLVVGLECGGSDGFSGISANPALGYASDLIVALGGTTVLSEFPELNGVEQELVNRCITEESAEKFLQLMSVYSKKAQSVGSGFDMNPSPGNIKDGLITDAMKSAGAAKKGGTAPISDVLDYTEQITKTGLHLLCTPGNDVESTTALVGSGANLIVFTTGLGTPTGNPIAPTIKMSSNTTLFKKMNDIIDFNAGTIITGEDSIESKGAELLDFIIRIASGEITPKAVQLKQDDFIPWKRGISL